MLAAWYDLILDLALSPNFEAAVTRTRAALLSVLSASLGAVAGGGLRLVDSKSAILGAVGAAAVLGVALVVDAIGAARELAATRKDVADLRDESAAHKRELGKVRDHLSDIEGIAASTKLTGDILLRRSSHDLGEIGRADRTGPNKAIP